MSNTLEEHVRRMIDMVAPWDIPGFGPDCWLSAGELVAAANYLGRILAEERDAARSDQRDEIRRLQDEVSHLRAELHLARQRLPIIET